jgi:uncharacterized protein (TIGR00266 family)
MGQPTIPIRIIPLESGQELQVEPGAMHACKNVELTTGLNGTVWEAAKQYFLGGESIFSNKYKATDKGAWVALEEGHLGQVASYQLAPGETLYLQKGAYVASDKNIKISTCFAGFSYYFKGLGMWKISATAPQDAPGRIFFDTKDGVIKAIKVDEAEGPVLLDNDSIIGYTDKVSLSLKRLGNARTMLFSGEGFVNETKGSGTVFIGKGISKVEKANYIEQKVVATIEDLTDGNLKAATIAALAAFIIVGTSRAANGGEQINLFEFAKDLINELRA